MIKSEHIYGDSKRLFLNTELGCASACTYCYLPSEGFGIGLNKSEFTYRIEAETLINALERDPRVKFGKDGTLLSIGCFSEAWDPRNREGTIQAIKALLPYGNPLQLATKRKIGVEDLRKITSCPAWQGQLSIYISSATISHWRDYEPLTVSPAKRFESFDSCSVFGVDVCLYIKPLIPSITIKDVDQYGALMEKYKIVSIVGERFTVAQQGTTSPISKTLFINQNDETRIMRERLSVYGHVFTKSEFALAHLRKI